MKVLCLCRQGMNRSRYLAEFLHEKGYESMYAGVDPYASNSVDQEMIDWADVIITARDVHADILQQRFPTKKRVIALNITNDAFHSASMQQSVREQIESILPLD